MIRHSSGSPNHCNRQAYEHFFAAVSDLGNSRDALIRAASAISMHAFDDQSFGAAVDHLDELAERIRRRVAHPTPEAMVAQMHHLLFQQMFERQGFRGAACPTALHCYVPQVLALGEGTAEALCLIYKAVGERLNLSIDGIAAPKRFLARVNLGTRSIYVDPFRRGRLVEPCELRRFCPQAARPVSHARWLRRLLSELQRLFACEQRSHDLGAMSELQRLLD